MSLSSIFLELYEKREISDVVYKRALKKWLGEECILRNDIVKVDFIENEIVDQSWTIIDIISKKVPIKWEKIFVDSYKDLVEISNQIDNNLYFPLKKDLFNVFHLCDPDKVKVVILGQEPYHSIDQNGFPIAHGLSFSVKNNKIPTSLQNIFKEIKSSISNFSIPISGDLTPWVNQGVFLLNTCLTVKPSIPGSHGQIWNSFISKVITEICNQNKNVIFVLWGANAQKFKSKISEKITVLEAVHPCGLSASKGFFGCKHFSTINQKLKSLGETEIVWNL